MRDTDPIGMRLMEWIATWIEIKWHSLKTLPDTIFFALPIGMTVKIAWPTHSKNGTTDPNGAWRDWLEANVGKQGRTWQWRHYYYDVDVIEVKILKKKEALMFALMAG